jgi:alcohol dehydrogenase (cytochrome c)
MRTRSSVRARFAVVLLAALGMLVAACGAYTTSAGHTAGSPGQTVIEASTTGPSGSWPYPNYDLANTRDATGSVISSANVSRLRHAWTFRLSGAAAQGDYGFGSLTAAPIVVKGVVYLQDMDENVYALSLKTGRLRWQYHVNRQETSGPGPDGVAVAGGVVYGDSSRTFFALKARTGRPIWIDRHLLSSGQGQFEIQPQVVDGRVYLASAYGTGPGGGLLIALKSSNGRVLWKFKTLKGSNGGVQSVGIGAGGAWETPLVGSDGSVTYGIGNPYQSAESAIAHPSRMLYTDSDVNLNAATGKLRWYYQGVPNDFMDHDMQSSPIAAAIKGTPVVLGAGKMGFVYAMNARTGRLIWKTRVGEHSKSDDYSVKALRHKLRLTAPYTILPGSFGGVLSNMALAGDTVYVAAINLPFTIPVLSYSFGTADGTGTGQLEALNLTTGKVEWDARLRSMPLGAATVSNNLVFTTLYDGVLIAFNRDTGAIVYRHDLPTSANSPIAIAGNTVLIPAGGPTYLAKGGSPQLVAYTVR